jgi:hypothetical protein
MSSVSGKGRSGSMNLLGRIWRRLYLVADQGAQARRPHCEQVLSTRRDDTITGHATLVPLSTVLLR